MSTSRLSDVATPRQVRTRQLTSFGRDPDRGGTFLGTRPAAARRKRVFLAAGETHTMARIQGAGAITRLWMTVLPVASRALRDVVLRMYWDDEPAPSVECPLGDFFGAPLGRRLSYVSEPLTIANGAYLCSWPMPFETSARLDVTNEGSTPVDPLFYQVTYSERPAAEHRLRFHAQWRRQNPTQRGSPYVILDARGQGHYVGCHLFMQNREWWLRPQLRQIIFPYGFGLGLLEGRESIHVDSETQPSISGTGTEDYFNGAWYNLVTGRVSAPHHGCTVRDLLRARVAMYRFDISAPVPFTQSISVAMDHGLENELEGDYTSVAYWYQAEPHAPFQALAPPAHRAPTSGGLNLLQVILLLVAPALVVALIVLSIFLFLESAVQARQPLDDLAERIDSIARQSLDRPNAGVSIAVALNGRMVLAQGYGMADRSQAVRVTPDSIFHVASISKNIAAAAVLSLVDGGKLRLDDDVRKYVPSAPTHGARVTIQQLLNHTSGIFSFTSLPGADANELLDLTHDQTMALIKDRPLDFTPGSSWRYNNSGFYLAGMIVERVTGQTYSAFIRERFFQPLGMSSSSLCTVHDEVPRLVSAYVRRKNELVNGPLMTWTLPFSGGSVCATATDLTTWQMALDSGRVLKPATLALMRRPTELADGTRIDYGLGTRLGSFLGHRVLGHTGSGGGFTTVLEHFPDDRLTIAVLINTDGGAATSVAADIARVALGVKEAPLQDQPASKQELTAIAGAYDSDEGPVTLMPCGERLCFALPGAGAEPMPVRRQGPFVYAIDRNNEVKFVERRGRVDWNLLYTGGLMTDAKQRVR